MTLVVLFGIEIQNKDCKVTEKVTRYDEITGKPYQKKITSYVNSCTIGSGIDAQPMIDHDWNDEVMLFGSGCNFVGIELTDIDTEEMKTLTELAAIDCTGAKQKLMDELGAIYPAETCKRIVDQCEVILYNWTY